MIFPFWPETAINLISSPENEVFLKNSFYLDGERREIYSLEFDSCQIQGCMR